MAAPSTTPAAISLESISLRKQERGLIVGGVDSGKSTLAGLLCQDFVHRYTAAGARLLILDSKPRFRAEWTVQGVAAAPRYRKWSHGPVLAGSCVVDNPGDLEFAFKRHRIVIVQSMSGRELPRLAKAAKLFLDESRASRPQLVYVDETLDFFHKNGSPKGGDDIIIVLARAGRERGTAALYGSQRTYGLDAVLLGEMSRMYALRLDSRKDAGRLQEFGAPPFAMPLEPHEFMYWWKGDYRRVWGPYKLQLPRGRR